MTLFRYARGATWLSTVLLLALTARADNLFTCSVARVTIGYVAGGSEAVYLMGPSAVNTVIGPNGEAVDTDFDGRDQAGASITSLDLWGQSSLGLIHLVLNPLYASSGEHEEQANNTAGILDVKPYTPAGTADSFFDVYFQFESQGQVFRGATGALVTATLTSLPPTGDSTYVCTPQPPIGLVTTSGVPTGLLVSNVRYTPSPVIERDVFSNAVGRFSLQRPVGNAESIRVTGALTIDAVVPPDGTASDTDSDGLDQVMARLTSLDMTGIGSSGPVRVSLNPARPAVGQIEEKANSTPNVLDVPPFTATGTANSFFDAYYRVEVDGQVLYADAFALMQSSISAKPAGPGDTYTNMSATAIQLSDADGKASGYSLTSESFTPLPVIETDQYARAEIALTLRNRQGDAEVEASGLLVLRVGIPSGGAASDTDGDGLDQVSVDVSELKLTGSASNGAVVVELHPVLPCMGEIEETANNTPGLLDVPPFAPAGGASFVADMYVEIEYGGQVMRNSDPIRIGGMVGHKPPETGELLRYQAGSINPVPLGDTNGVPNGVSVVDGWLVPEPPELEISAPSAGTALLRWDMPSPGYVLQISPGPEPGMGWTNTGASPAAEPPWFSVTTNTDGVLQFYRLRRPLP